MGRKILDYPDRKMIIENFTENRLLYEIILESKIVHILPIIQSE